MAKPRLFIGSSQTNLAAAQAIAEGLKKRADISLWNDKVFNLSEAYLETLSKKPTQYDFAVFVFAADDVTTSKDKRRKSPRDNVIFESGLFMGMMGRMNVFLAYDKSARLKIPTDLDGVTLAEYDGSLINQNPEQAVGEACAKIVHEINRPRFPQLVGRWKSIYRLTTEEGCPDCEEEVEIRDSRDGVSITCINTSHRSEEYTAFGRLPQVRQIVGEWNSSAECTDTGGIFALKVSENSHFMYGYFTSPAEEGGVVYAGWVLAKMANADQNEIEARLKEARSRLAEKTIGFC